VTVSLDSGDAPLTDPTGHLTTAQALAERLHIAATPAFAFFDDEGRVLYRYVGDLPEPVDLQALSRYVSEAGYEREPFAEYRRRRQP
jgi:thioredoxin-related protein